MKILIFGHKRIPSRDGGVEVVVTELSTRMAQLDHTVICCSRGGSSGEYRKVRLKPMPTLPGKGLAAVSSSFFAAIYSAFRNADAVHIHGEGPAFWSWIPKLAGKRVVVTIHGLDWQREKWKGSFGEKFIRAGERMAVRFADAVIVLSRSAQRYFRETYGRKTVYIPNGVTVPQRKEPEKIKEFGLEKDGYLLFLGRLVPEKGVHYLIEAFRMLNTDKRLVIAGCSSDTDAYVSMLRSMAQGDKRIVFPGFVQGQMLEELYSNAYCYILPSDVEGMPLTLLEAMSYGNCCVVSDIPECREVTGDHAVTFPKGDISALRECLQRLCDAPLLVAQYKHSAADTVLFGFSWDDAVRKTLELYHEDPADQ